MRILASPSNFSIFLHKSTPLPVDTHKVLNGRLVRIQSLATANYKYVHPFQWAFGNRPLSAQEKTMK